MASLPSELLPPAMRAVAYAPRRRSKQSNSKSFQRKSTSAHSRRKNSASRAMVDVAIAAQKSRPKSCSNDATCGPWGSDGHGGGAAGGAGAAASKLLSPASKLRTLLLLLLPLAELLSVGSRFGRRCGRSGGKSVAAASSRCIVPPCPSVGPVQIDWMPGVHTMARTSA